MRYAQYRLVKKDGEIVQQRRYFTIETRPAFKWWQVWKWGEFESFYDYGEWEDMPFVEV